jgi:endoglucanase Acf2
MSKTGRFAAAEAASYGSIQSARQDTDVEQTPDQKQISDPSVGCYDGVNRRRAVSIPIFLVLISIVTMISFPLMNSTGIVLFPAATQSNNTSTGSVRDSSSAASELTQVPFPYIDRSEYGSNPVPPSSIVNPDLFSPSLLGEDGRFLKVPFPTGAFWTNLVMEPTEDRLLSYPVMAYPYGFKWSPDMLQVSLPSLRRLMDSVSIRDIFNPDLTLTTVETVLHRYIHYFDPLSITLRFQASEEALWESFIVQGSPYVTARYQNMTPIIRALSVFHGISCLENANNNCASLSNDSTEQVRCTFVHIRGWFQFS